MNHSLGILLSIALFAAAATADETQIDALVRQLSHEQWDLRQQAEDELVEFSDDAVPALQRLIEAGGDDESVARAQSALRRIEREHLIGPSIIRLEFQEAHPREIFEELARQARTTINTQPPDLWENRTWQPITVAIDRLPFWQALAQLCDIVQLYPMPSSQDAGITLGDASANWAGAAVYSGAFLVAATRIHRASHVDLTRPDHITRNLQLQLVLIPEPKLRILQHSGVEVHEVTDEHGTSLLRPQAVVAMPAGVVARNRGVRWNSAIPLDGDAETGTRIARLKATSRFLLQTGADRLELPDALAAQNTTHVLGGRTVTIQEAKQTDNQIELRITVPREGAREDWPGGQQLGQSVELLDAKGRALNRTGSGASASREQWEFRWNFLRQLPQGQQAEGPYTLVFEVPSETREVDVPFEFTDLPLP